MAVYEDSYVIIWHGPRRGGKSISMAYEEAIALLNGRRVFADSPVQFLYPNEDGSWTKYKSEPLNYDEFLFVTEDDALKKKYTRAVVAWDEVDKWMFSRNFNSVFSKITSQFITLIGKLEMTFLMTAQFIHLVDKNIRIQVDAEIGCTDLSFLYPHLGRGTNVGWIAKDISGRYTGQMYQDTGMEYQATLYAKPFWDIYDTKHAPSILDSMQKREIKQDKHIIDLREGRGGLEEDLDERNHGKNYLIMEHMVEEMRDSGTTYRRGEIVKMAKERGYTDSSYILFSALNRIGVIPIQNNRYTVLEGVA